MKTCDEIIKCIKEKKEFYLDGYGYIYPETDIVWIQQGNIYIEKSFENIPQTAIGWQGREEDKIWDKIFITPPHPGE